MSDNSTPSGSPTDAEVGAKNKERFEQALADFYSIHLAVSYHPEVVLPEHLKTPAWKAGTEYVHLEYGLDMPVPIVDMEITEKGIKATLSFARVPFTTFVPWDAVEGARVDGARPPPPKPKFKLKSV
jgi:hypothetical protein